MAVVVGHNRDGSGLGMAAGLVAVGGTVGMEVRPDHTGVHSWIGIIVWGLLAVRWPFVGRPSCV